MNYIKAQKDVFGALCAGNKLGRFALDDNSTFVTPNGYMGYIFPNATINFSLEKIPELRAIRIREIVSEENRLTLTPDLRLDEYHRKMLRRLKGKDKNVFVNVKFLECFQNPEFYQEGNANTAIVVVEKMSIGGHGSRSFYDNVVGVVLPVRCNHLQGDYYDYADEMRAEHDGEEDQQQTEGRSL